MVRMTVIAAQIDLAAKCIWVGADSCETLMPSEIRLADPSKLQKHPTSPMVFGACGNPEIGKDDFGLWLKKQPSLSKDWDKFKKQAANKLAELNGQQRQRTLLAGVTPGDNDGATVLLASWLDGPEILELGDDGKPTSHTQRGFYAVGAGAPVALVAHAVLADCITDLKDRFTRCMNAAATMGQLCAPPIHIWRVAADGVTEVIP